MPITPSDPHAPATDPREAGDTATLASRQRLPQVARKGGGDWLMGLGGLGMVALLGGITFATMNQARHARLASPPPATPAATTLAAPALANGAPPPVPAAAITRLAPPAPGAAMGPAMGGVVGGVNPLAAPGLVYDGGAPAGAPAPAAPAPASPAPAAGGDEFALRAAAPAGTSVAAASFDPATTISQGTLIPAILETAIDTDVPGYVRAIVSADVRAFDGGQVLVPRSSRLVGQYKSGLQAGQRRVYVIWSRLIRPDGVSVALGSPATGYDGQSGLGGSVNTHFFERFGSALLLSVVSGLSSFSSGSTNVVIAGSGQSAAAAAVGQTGQIGPTVRVRPGEPIRVFTARDLDFSGAPWLAGAGRRAPARGPGQ